jgi:hypothetical protein
MTIEILAKFFMWCTILNAALLALSFSVVAFGLGGDRVYRIHSRWFPMTRDAFNTVLYLLIGIYKIFLFVFNIVPWIALTIIA